MSEFNLHNQFSMTSGHPRHERPLWIWDQDTASFVWANGEGVKFWSALSLERLQAMAFDKSHPAWLAVCCALSSKDYLNRADRARGIDLELHFPNNNRGLNWTANCRRGMLQDRNAIIVELKGAAPLRSELTAEGMTEASALDTALATTSEAAALFDEVSTVDVSSSDTPSSVPQKEMNGAGSAVTLQECTTEIEGQDGAPDAEASLLDSLLDNMTISDEAIQELKSSIQPLSNESSSVKINGVWIGERAGDATAESAGSGAHKFSPFDRANLDKSGRLVTRAPKDQLYELARLIKEAGASELLEADAAFINEAVALDELDNVDNLTSDKAGKDDRDDALVLAAVSGIGDVVVGSVDMVALKGVGDQDELERILDAADEPVALISLQKMLHANPLFVTEFGYGDIISLINDGCDWIFPSSREMLSALLEGPSGDTDLSGPGNNGALFDEVRLRSGRRMKRDVWFTPVRLVKFDRTLLLVRLADQFSNLAEDVPSQVIAFDEAGPSDDGIGHLDLSSVPLMSSISHEVRTPLNVIIGFSELMMREQFGPLGNEKYHGYANDIHTSALHALSLINDLLDLTKLKAGKWDIFKEPLDLNEIVRSQVSMMREMTAQNSLRLRSDLEENLPLVMLDKRGINQILLNLISNAIKFNNEFGRIIVETERIDQKTIRLSVRDTGRGMSEDEIAQAMEPFHQVARDPLSKVGSLGGGKGTGLGLPIAKALSEANDVNFSIMSEKDSGTEITLLIQVQD